ncbi:MAG: hypothetical protein GY788_05100, partial [bacterium]|nr:hypothetical protein [bacterium]
GTHKEMPGAADDENFRLAVQGYCSRREHGDRITPFSDSNGSSNDNNPNSGFEGCDPGAGGQGDVRENPEYTADGYFYGIEFLADQPGATYKVALRDAAYCPTGGGSIDSGSQGDNTVTYRLRNNDHFDPTQTTPIDSITLTRSDADCNVHRGQWVEPPELTIASPTTGIYYLQVQPEIPTDHAGVDAREANNKFGVAVYNTASGSKPADPPDTWSWMCTTNADEVTADVPLNPNCPNVFGQSHLGIFIEDLDLPGGGVAVNADFYLAEINEAHQGRTVLVELFDSAESMEEVQVLDPDDNPITFEWEVACQDSSYQSESGACGTGENAPNGGYGPVANQTVLDVRGEYSWDSTTPNCRWRPWGIDNSDSPSTGCRNHQGGKYSDRLIRLKFQLPKSGDFPVGQSWFTGGDWFRMRYRTANAPGDRTTWSVSILGDPVRLVENAPAP